MSKGELADRPTPFVLILGFVAALAFPLSGAQAQRMPGAALGFPDSAFVVLMDEPGVTALAGPDGAVIRGSRGASGQTELAVLSGVSGDTPSTGRPGIYLTIPAEIERAASGRLVKVTVVARRPPNAGADRSFAVAYSTAEVGNSGWQRFELTDTLTPYSFTYVVPTMESGGGDFVGILPDPDFGVGAVEIAAVAVEPISNPPQSTAFYDLSVERVALPPVESRRGALAKVGDLLLYAAQKGRLYVISDLGASIQEVDLTIPLPHEHPLLAQGEPSWVSVFDIAAEPSASGELGHYDLYASYLEVDDERRCIALALSKAMVAVAGDELNAVAGWEEVFRAEPCVPLTSTNSTGGRIDFDADGIVLTVGTFNAIAGDYGTIVRLDRTTFDKHTISRGLRNPQGLFIDGDGTIFETEHGPQGGDELNIIEDGKNYGWPVVAYGTDYDEKDYCEARPCDPGAPPESQGHHLGFEQPMYAFVPSVGISQIIQVTRDGEFPIWRGDLLVASMAARSLYRVHLYERRAVVVEPIRIGASLRDMIELDDGRIAILTDERELLVISNADRSAFER